jgi:hypothetical protein
MTATQKMEKIKTIPANWPAPAHVHALTTTRMGGVSAAPYDTFNLGDHVGDDPNAVKMNRTLLRQALKLPGEPLWLRQVHGIEVVDATSAAAGVTADGAYTNQAGVVLAVLTADCLPIFLCDRDGTEIGIVHAGWRGLVGGVIEAGLRALGAPRHHLLAHLGPAIGPQSYEVGDEVRQEFVRQDAQASRAFAAVEEGKWLADLYELARMRLHAYGVTHISGGEHCTWREREALYSYRRDAVTGRLASLIWLDSLPAPDADGLDE